MGALPLGSLALLHQGQAESGQGLGISRQLGPFGGVGLGLQIRQAQALAVAAGRWGLGTGGALRHDFANAAVCLLQLEIMLGGFRRIGRAHHFAVFRDRVLALENRNRGVRFNSVLPGTIDTPANRSAMPDANTAAWTTPEAIARVMAFLLSSRSAAVTGALVPVDGPA